MNNKFITPVSLGTIIFLGFLLFRTSLPGISTTPQSETMQTPPQNAATPTTLTSAQLAVMLSRKDFFFVNVHVPYQGEINDTDAFIPYDKIADNLDALPKDKNTKIVLYCQSGRMSEIAAQELVRLGYKRVSHLTGGMIDWERSGYEI